jgi:hypothetical protein
LSIRLDGSVAPCFELYSDNKDWGKSIQSGCIEATQAAIYLSLPLHMQFLCLPSYPDRSVLDTIWAHAPMIIVRVPHRGWRYFRRKALKLQFFLVFDAPQRYLFNNIPNRHPM